MSIEDYRASYEAEVAAALDDAARNTAADPLTSSPDRSGEARLAGPDDGVRAVVQDAGADASARVAAIDAARLDAISQPDVVRLLLALLQDQTDDPAVRHAALGALEELSFAVATFAPYDAEYHSALRAAATDADPPLREAVLEVLALDHDEYAQRLLVDGLQDPSAALVDRTRALQFLGYDLHAGHYEMLREIVAQATDPEERTAALRLLAADSGSAELFRRIVQDRSEDVAARTTSAVALSSLEPTAFAPVARQIVLDESDDDDLRAVCLTALTVTPADDGDPDLADRVMSGQAAPSTELKQAVDRYRETKAPGG
ncbi:MAG: hypothetical protein ACRDST_16615 [Pseudonocardiaceae bacterium]